MRRRVWAIAAILMAFSVTACGGSSHATHTTSQKDVQACWTRTLAKWVTTSYAAWAQQIQASGLSSGPPESQSTYHDQVFGDASYYEAGKQPPGGINADEQSEFATVQRACGKLKVTVS